MSADDAEQMRRMRRWLESVRDELGIAPSVLESNTDTLLALVGHVAHGPSRPGAPMTAFLVGLAAGAAVPGSDDPASAAEQAQAVADRISTVEHLVAEWRTT